MVEASDPSAYIFEGVWTNWSKGAVTGLTLTLAPIRATLLTNSLALFVALAGSQLWTIMRFGLHQYRASPQNSTLLRDQEQLILRNASTDLTTTQLMWGLAWTSRKRYAGKMSSHAIFVGFLGLIHAALLIAAGTFSNQLVNAGPTVLSRSPYCGYWNMTYYNEAIQYSYNALTNESLKLSFEAGTKYFLDMLKSFEYADSCYGTPSSESLVVQSSSTTTVLPPICQTLKQPKLNWTVRKAKCPFGSQLCHSGTSPIVLDTGELDSHEDLGINADVKDRLTFRRQTTCVPLNDTNYITGYKGYEPAVNSDPVQHVTYANYGVDQLKDLNYTYAYSSFASFYTNFSADVLIPYPLFTATAYDPQGPSAGVGDFVAIPEFEQRETDITLLFLSFTGTYVEQINDPWFSAQQVIRTRPNPSWPLLDVLYAREMPFSTLGCTEQYKFCTSAGICTPFNSFDMVQNDNTFNSSLTPNQNVTFGRILYAATSSSIGQITRALREASGRPLLAVDATGMGDHWISMGLPDNQWELELDYWHSISMANLQRVIGQLATGQIAAQTSYLLPPQLDQDKWFCKNFMIPSTVYQSFNMLALILVLVFGILTITVSFTIEEIAGFFRRRSGRGFGRWQKWVDDDMLSRPPPLPKDDNASVRTPQRNRSLDSTADEILVVRGGKAVYEITPTVRHSPPAQAPPQAPPPPYDHASSRRPRDQAISRQMNARPEPQIGHEAGPMFWV